jgi:hypothetical protein
VVTGDGGCEAYTAIAWGAGIFQRAIFGIVVARRRIRVERGRVEPSVSVAREQMSRGFAASCPNDFDPARFVASMKAIGVELSAVGPMDSPLIRLEYAESSS